jgi:hypothetical protein
MLIQISNVDHTGFHTWKLVLPFFSSIQQV